MASMTQPWTCPTCRTAVSTPFCPSCGERPVGARDLTLKSISAQLFKALGGVDGRLLRTLRALIGRPGSLTVAYQQGQRKPYVGPFQLFLLCNLIFFTAQSLSHTKIFSSPLDSHLHRQDWSDLAQQLVARRLEATHVTLDHYAPVFDQAVVLNAKSLVFLMVLPFALLLPIFYLRSRRPFAVHAAFSLHLYAFLLLLFCVSLAVVAVDLFFGGAGLDAAWMDNVLTATNLVALGLYVYVSSGRVYAVQGAVRLFSALGLTLALGVILVGYRFAIFLITLYST
jgi:hypothetical protein